MSPIYLFGGNLGGEYCVSVLCVFFLDVSSKVILTLKGHGELLGH